MAAVIRCDRLEHPGHGLRASDYKSVSGGTMVYYAVDGGGQSVGYIIYLGQTGKVLRIE